MGDSVVTSAFHTISYGLYVISSTQSGRPVACVVNTFAQVTSQPPQVSVAVNKENCTAEGILETGSYAAVALIEDTPVDFIGSFGFRSSRDADKFAGVSSAVDGQGLVYPDEFAAARFSVKVSRHVDLGTHMLFIGEVVEALPMIPQPSITYDFYRKVKGGKTPPKAPSFDPDDTASITIDGSIEYAWRCKVCKHVEYRNELPADFHCPVCGMDRVMFERIIL